jgi:hypothetical protein
VDTDSKIEVFLDIESDLDSLEGRAFELIQVVNCVPIYIELNKNKKKEKKKRKIE